MVSPGPSPEEIRRALDMLQGDVFEDSHFPENPRRDKPAPFSGNTRAENHYKTQSMSDRSASTAPAAIRGEYSEVSGEGYGVVGATASSSGAGVAAIHLDGGPDLLLDGAEEGNPDTLLYEWGMYRSSGGSTGFSFRNPGHGSFVLDVEGEISADLMTCPSCVGSAELASSSVTSSKIAAGAVGTSQIGTGAVMSDNIAPYSVTTSKIADHAVSSSKLASSSVTSVKIADGTITADDIDPNAAIYTSGSTLYTVTSTTTISGGDDTGLAAAFCSDSNDLPLMGYCQVESVWMRIWGQEPSHWDNSGYQSGFVCNATNEGSGSHDLVAAIICITVIEN